MYLNKYGVARHIYLPMTKRAVIDFAIGADWTPAAGDVKISKDGGAFTNVTNLPTAIASANTGAVWDFSLTATEMQAAQVTVVISDATTKAVEDNFFTIETFGNASAELVFDLSQATPNVNVSTITNATITAAKFAADAIDNNALAANAATEIANAVAALTSSELTAVPTAASTLQQKIDWLFELARHKRTQTTSTETVFKDDGTTALSTSTKTDDGTTFTRAEYV